MARLLTLPLDSAERKEYPLFRGLWRYFPAALAGLARHSKKGNDKHNPGEEMHHARGKSSDHPDCILRHLMDLDGLLALLERGGYTEGEQATHEVRESILEEADALFWRAGALSQELHERFDDAPLAPGAKLPDPHDREVRIWSDANCVTLGDGSCVGKDCIHNMPAPCSARPVYCLGAEPYCIAPFCSCEEQPGPWTPACNTTQGPCRCGAWH